MLFGVGTDISEEPAFSIFKVPSTLKMEAADSPRLCDMLYDSVTIETV
jgi:hypothetical protein